MTAKEATNKLFEATQISAMQDGNLDQATAALDAGADPNAEAEWKRTPLHFAVTGGDTDLARLLIENGADLIAVDYRQ
jgi:ankyrin repeat protein